MKRAWVTLLAAALLAGCETSTLPPDASSVAPKAVEPEAATPKATVGFTRVTDAAWDVTAVRKVLRTFAYGGHATEAQIRAWANMTPRSAIVQMLNFATSNTLLSPPAASDTDDLPSLNGTLFNLSGFWQGDDPKNNTPVARRPEFRRTTWDAPQRLWVRAARSRGLNPFRQKIGLWETNYHLAVNNQVGVTYRQQLRYYDEIMDALARREPYQRVLALAAESAAVATQYGHRLNRWVDGDCECNEDFAREFHQLFFGILGNYSPALHERYTIKNTARALTDMEVPVDSDGMLTEEVRFGWRFHSRGPLRILEQNVPGTTAQEHLDALAEVAILHPESLEALPVKIVSGLADDNLTATKLRQIREEWASMPDKSLLEFLREYAISTIFHSPDRVKHLSSVDRYMLIATQSTLKNIEAAIDLYYPQYGINDDDVQIFAPTHNVFGSQTGLEAAASGEVFRNHYLRSTEYNWIYPVEFEAWGVRYNKDWRGLVVGSATDNYRVSQVAELLWDRFIADGRKNFGALERGQVYAFLARGMDLAAVMELDDPDHVFTEAEMLTPRLQQRLATLGSAQMLLANANTGARREANWRVQQAIDFIIATPYMFVDEGR